ncbi:MAG: thioredoxin family protein [Acidobacteriota bacterium]
MSIMTWILTAALLPATVGDAPVAAEETETAEAAIEAAEVAEEVVEDDVEEKKPPSLLGEVSREQIELAEPTWVAAQVEAEVEADAALELSTLEGGDVSVTVYLGTWCDDSKRELARFWRALDDAGYFDVDVTYLAVDRSDKRPPELAEDQQIFWVPTFIVERGGEEVGRLSLRSTAR